MNRKRRFTIIAVWVWIVLLSAAQSGWAETSVVYRLKWLQNMSTVGDLYANAGGYFAAQGLKVSIKAGGPERDAIRELELGQAQFGVASADQVIRALSKGAPIVVIAQLFQDNPLHWIYRRDRIRMARPEDLKSKIVGVTFGKNDEIIMRTLLSRAGLGDTEVRLFSVRLDYAPFYKGEVDLWPVYINTQGIEIGAKLTSAGEEVGFFNPSRHGVRFVANSVVTSVKLAQQQPEMVRRFIGALLEGWRQAMDPANAEQAVAVVRQVDRDTRLELLNAQLDATRKLIRPTPQAIIGSIDRSAWRQTEAIMLDNQQIDGPVDVEKHLRPIDVSELN